ncbi:hypothetical protein PHYPSEUDO_009880 [Phytophthora pseudosyringae]|uniref:Uncharacterized protein n=1 Tax=Phytophthora pseudosyringae TaxID=221518 RepID=A0A8T1W869_9STRA|nr:hypothetical protein PHYPSEUDO_009880 [Phytophthora pseudosyringae]
MDVILSRAGLSSTQQRSVCFGAVQDEVRQTEIKLVDAIASLKRLQDVVHVARDVHNAQRSVVTLPPDVEVSVKRMAQASEKVGPMLREIQSMLNAFTLSSRSRGPSGYSTEDEDEEEVEESEWTRNRERTRQQYAGAASSGPQGASIRGSSGWMASWRERNSAAAPSFFRMRDPKRAGGLSIPQVADSDISEASIYGAVSDRFAASTGYVGQKRRATSPPRSAGHSFLRPTPPGELLIRRELDRQSIWPRHHQYRMLHSRPRSPVQQSEKKVAQVIDGLEQRLSKLPEEEHGGVFSTSVTLALKIARLTRVKGEEASVQEAIDSARAAVNDLLERNSSSPDSDELHHRLEDLRQVLAVVVRAVLDTNGNLEALGLRNMLDLIKKVQDTFPGSSARFKWYVTLP